MKIQKGRLGTLPALLVAVLTFASFAGAAALITHGKLGFVSVSFAEDGENSSSSSDSQEQQKQADEKKSESDKKAAEATKKQAERDREASKKAAERASESVRGGSNDKIDDQEGDVENDRTGSNDTNGGTVEDSNDEDAIAGDEDDNNGMFKDRTKTVSKLQERIAEAEKQILEKQAEGVDVTAALARLAAAKAAFNSVGGAFESNDLEKAKELGQEVNKLAHFSVENDLHDAKEVGGKVSEVSKRITQTQGKIVLLEAVGGDAGQFKTALASFQSDLDALKATIAAGGFDPAVTATALETLDHKVKALKNSIEGSIYALGGTDSRMDDDYESETNDVVDHLKTVADIEDDNVGHVVRALADEQKASVKTVGDAVNRIDQHNRVLQLLLGTNKADLGSLERTVADNKSRIALLTRAADTIGDQDVKKIILDQVETLKEETNKLETFISGQQDRLSLFGWFFNLF